MQYFWDLFASPANFDTPADWFAYTPGQTLGGSGTVPGASDDVLLGSTSAYPGTLNVTTSVSVRSLNADGSFGTGTGPTINLTGPSADLTVASLDSDSTIGFAVGFPAGAPAYGNQTVQFSGANETFNLSGGAKFSFATPSDIGSDATINFADGAGDLVILQNADGLGEAVPQTFTGFVAGDAIEFFGPGSAAALTAGLTYANGVLDVTSSFSLKLPGFGGATDFSVINAPGSTGGGVFELVVAPCFCAGTRIATPHGEVPVESLRPGDTVVTHSGAIQPVVWVGHRRFDARRHPAPEQVWPIRIAAGALDEGLPRRDLLVSPGHALLLDGVLMQAERLVNGVTITRDRTIERGCYYHVELPSHDILLSEGAPSESYLDTGNRVAFASAAGAVALHPDFSPRHWTETCVPLVTDGPRLAAARARLAARAEALLARSGWRAPATTRDPDLRLVAGGRNVSALYAGPGEVKFALARRRGPWRLVSRAQVPSVLDLQSNDSRRLGVCVSRIVVRGPHGRREVALDDPTLTRGWWDLERDGDRSWRWTDGDASLPTLRGAEWLEITLGGDIAYAPDEEQSQMAELARLSA